MPTWETRWSRIRRAAAGFSTQPFRRRSGGASRARSTRSRNRSRICRPSSRNEPATEPATAARAGRRRSVAAVAAGSGGVLVARGGESSADGTAGTIPFYGDHQAGILTPQQHHLQFASYDLTAGNIAELRDLLGTWTGLASHLTRGDNPPSTGGELAPPDDTGESGGLDPARLTITFGFGPGLFDDRYGLAAKRPPELADLPLFEKDQLVAAQSGGDICIQACSNDPQVAFHAIANLTRDGRGGATLRWLQKGFLSPPTEAAAPLAT